MTFEQLIEVVHGLQSEMTPETGARGAEDLASEITLLASVNLDVDAVLAFATSGKPVASTISAGFCAGPAAALQAAVPADARESGAEKRRCVARYD
jgi:dienelactone hydrolase